MTKTINRLIALEEPYKINGRPNKIVNQIFFFLLDIYIKQNKKVNWLKLY